MRVADLAGNPFAENTYVVWDEVTRACALIDPGVSNTAERGALVTLLAERQLVPSACWLTHAHIDHVLGVAWVHETFGLRPWLAAAERDWYKRAPEIGAMYGLGPLPRLPEPAGLLQAGKTLALGELELEVLATPGHSAGSVCFFHAVSRQVVVGDVLFRGSIGRTDLPGGSLDVLMHSIFQVLLPLGDDVRAYPGHGPSTTLGHERLTNPFLT